MIDEIAFFVFCGSILAYWLLVRYRIQHPGAFKRSVLNQLYQNWVDARLKGDIIDAVQALRNLIMACSIFITALLVFIGLLVQAFQIQVESTIRFLGLASLSLGLVKVGLNVVLIFASLFCFVMAIRRAIRVTLLLSADPGSVREGEIDGVLLAKNAFTSAQNYWMFGIRLIFYTVSVTSWLISPVIFLASSVIIMIYLVAFEDVWSVK